jgi:hypothetical protein
MPSFSQTSSEAAMLYVDLFDSRAIAMFAYDLESRSLLIRFKGGGGMYAYPDVPREVFEGFRQARSKGRFFGSEIRDRFAGRRLAPTEVAAIERANAGGGSPALCCPGRVDIAALETRGKTAVFF